MGLFLVSVIGLCWVPGVVGFEPVDQSLLKNTFYTLNLLEPIEVQGHKEP